MSTPSLLKKKLNKKYRITQIEIETALSNNTDLCDLVASKFNIDREQIKRICDAYMSLLIIKKNELEGR